MGIFSDLEPLNDDMATYTGFIKGHEGKKLTAYKPIKTEKYFTIGYGHYGVDNNCLAVVYFVLALS